MFHIFKRFNTWFTLLSVGLAILFGVLAPGVFDSIHFIGDIFINLLKLFALPLICTALISALGALGGHLTQLKRLARNAVGYILLSEVVAVTIALVLFNAFRPGVGLNPNLILHGKDDIVPTDYGHLSFAQFFLSIFPHNIFESLSEFELLPVVVFSILFGLGCSFAGKNTSGKNTRPVVDLAVGIRDTSMACLHGVMALAPVGIFVLVGTGVAQAYQSGHLRGDFFALLNFVAVLLVGLFLHALWQLILVLVLTRQKVAHVLTESMSIFTTAFATSSSVATLPIAMETADRLKASPITTRFMLPLCASINLGGMMMYEVAAALFFSQMLGLDLSIQQQILVAVACILGGMAEGGIPETSMVSLVVVFKIVHVPLSAISILLPLDRIIDRLRTVVNIFGNMCGVIVVSQVTPVVEDGESSA